MYRAISQKTVCWDSNEELLHPIYGRLFYCGLFSPLWYIWTTFIVLCR